MRTYLTVPIAAAVLMFAAAPATAFVDKDCSDFSSWAQAQKYFKKHGGPRHDPSRLDADHDGIPCESLR